MIFRAQSLQSIKAHRLTQPAASSKLPGTTSQRHSASLSRNGSVADVQRLYSVCESCTEKSDASTSAATSKELKPSIAEYQDGASVLSIVSLAAGLLLMGGPAYAAYDRVAGDQLFKNLAGGAYVLLVCFFFYRLFRKRAQSGTTQSLRGQFQESLQDEMKAKESREVEKPVTPVGALWGAVQAGAICFVLFQLCSLVDGYFANQEMPDQYTARNITVTLRTIVRGLAYLMTFLFGVNCVGLSGLAVQLVFFPETPIGEKQEDKAQS